MMTTMTKYARHAALIAALAVLPLFSAPARAVVSTSDNYQLERAVVPGGGGRAADAPNLVLAGAAIAILPPVIIYIFGQRFFVESTATSGLKG